MNRKVPSTMPLFASRKSSQGSSPAQPETEAPAEDAHQAPSVPGRTPVKGRRRPTLIALGIALIAVCALGAWWVVESSSEATPVVVAARDIPAGTLIDKGDLTTIEADIPPGAQVVPGEDLSGLLGKQATGPIQQGALVSPDQITDTPIPEAGTAVVGIKAKPGQMPAANVEPGDSVSVIGTPREADDPPTGEVPVFAGTVQSVSAPLSDGSVVVDVVVAKEDAPALAALAATGRISVILTAGRL